MNSKDKKVENKPDRYRKETPLEPVEARLLTVSEAAYVLGLAPRTLYNKVAPGSREPFPIKPKRIGRSLRFDKREIDAWIDAL